MTLPNILLGSVIACLLGVIFHLLRGGNPGRLIVFLILGSIGFWLGHILGDKLGLVFLSIGPLHLGMASIGAVITLVIGSWLTKVERSEK
jgi:uncharacterized membrane protein YeaQ/YmgE (transglycosylase-associated protein family)